LDTTVRTGTSFGGEKPDAWRLWAFEPELHVHAFVHDAPKDSISEFTQKVGRAKLPVPWTFGLRRRMDRGAMIQGMREIDLLRKLNIPVTGCDDALHFLPIGSQVGMEASLKSYNDTLHSLGYKAIGYYNAYVATTDVRAAADLMEGRMKGYFVKLGDGAE